MIEVRLPYWKADKVGFNKMLDISEHLAQSGLEEPLRHMLYLRVSQINGCGYCVDVHWKDAVKAGVDPRKLNGVIAWRHTPFFSPREQAAFAWAEAVTTLEHQEVPTALFEAMKGHFSEEEIMSVTLHVTHMNAFNRLAIAFGRKADA
jgi:AhpD family alkylhydroperoxidase